MSQTVKTVQKTKAMTGLWAYFLKNLQSIILGVSRKKDEPWELKLSKGGSMNKEVLCGKVHDSVSDKDMPAFIRGIFLDFFPELCMQESYRLM